MSLAPVEASVLEQADRYLTDFSSRRDPYDFYRRLREAAPVLRTSLGVWLVSGFEEANHVLRNDELLSRREAALRHVVVNDPEARQIFTSRMLFNDRPEHTRLRRLVSTAFTPAGVRRWDERIREITDDRLAELKPKGRMELVHDFAYPVAETIITELLGVRGGDLHLFARWSAAMTEPPPGGDLESFRDAATAATKEFIVYARDRIAERRAAPADDLLSRLIAAEDEGGRLAEHELVAMTFELILAGHETTSNLIGNGMACLLRYPDQFALLRADRGLLPSAIEEMLRFESPAPMPMSRIAVADVTIGDVVVPEGETVVVLLAAANRDPKIVTHPDTFDIRRAESPHIAFGIGTHFCLGHALARLESSVILGRLLDELPGLESDGEAVWSDHQFFRALTALPVQW